MQGVPPSHGWYPDAFRRAELRFYDGARWTADVRAADTVWLDDTFALRYPPPPSTTTSDSWNGVADDGETASWKDQRYLLIALVIAAVTAFVAFADLSSDGQHDVQPVTWRTPICLLIGAVFVVRSLRRVVRVERDRVLLRGVWIDWSVPRSAIVACQVAPDDKPDRWRIRFATDAGQAFVVSITDPERGPQALQSLFSGRAVDRPSGARGRVRSWSAGPAIMATGLVFGIGAMVYDGGVRHLNQFAARNARSIDTMATVEGAYVRSHRGESGTWYDTAVLVSFTTATGVERARIIVRGADPAWPATVAISYDPEHPEDVDFQGRLQWAGEARGARAREIGGGVVAALAGLGLAVSTAWGFAPRNRRGPRLPVQPTTAVRSIDIEAEAREARAIAVERQTRAAAAVPWVPPKREMVDEWKRAAGGTPEFREATLLSGRRLVVCEPVNRLGSSRIHDLDGEVIGVAAGPRAPGRRASSVPMFGLYSVSDGAGGSRFDISWVFGKAGVRAMVRDSSGDALGFVSANHIQSPDGSFRATLDQDWPNPRASHTVRRIALVDGAGRSVAVLTVAGQWPGARRRRWSKHRSFVVVDVEEDMPVWARSLTIALVLIGAVSLTHRALSDDA